MDVYQEILSLRYEEVREPLELWHTDVKVFRVFEKGFGFDLDAD